MFANQHIGYHKIRHCSRSGKALGDAFFGDKMKPKKNKKQKTFLRQFSGKKTIKNDGSCKGYKILKIILPDLLQRQFLKRI